MCESLGAQFNKGKYFVLNPVTKDKMYTFYDPAHMVKPIRNSLGEKKILYNDNGESIKWEYIVRLFEKEKQEGLKVATKLTSRHSFY